MQPKNHIAPLPAISMVTVTIEQHRPIILQEGRTSFGYAQHNDVMVTGHGVAARHFDITVSAQVHLTNSDARTGTKVNGHWVSGPYPLSDGDVVQFGKVTAVVGITAAPPGSVAATEPTRRPRRKRGLLAPLSVLTVAAIVAGVVTVWSQSDVPAPPSPTEPSSHDASEDAPEDEQQAAPVLDPMILARHATVQITSSAGRGSGFVVDHDADGRPLIVTNAHVVEGDISVAIGNGHTAPQPATVLGASQCDDLAVVESDVVWPLPALQLADSATVTDDVEILGYPYTPVDDPTAMQVRKANVVSVHRSLTAPDRDLVASYRDLVQVSEPINPGNSGGPIVDSNEGRVIGVASFFTHPTSDYFGIDSQLVSRLLPALKNASSRLPGFMLEFDVGNPSPRVTSVTNQTLLAAPGVVGDGSQRLVAVNGIPFDGISFPHGIGSLCDRPEFRLGAGLPVQLTLGNPDGTQVNANVIY